MKKLFMLCAVIVLTALPAHAKKEAFLDLPDESVVEIMKQLRPELKNAYINETEKLGDETPEELADPLIAPVDGEKAIVQGVISQMAEFCGLDWRAKSLEPFMEQQRSYGRSDKQIAYLGLLHGIGMGFGEKSLESQKTCSAKTKERVANYLSK